MPSLWFETRLGPLTVREREGAIVGIDWRRGDATAATPLLREARRQLGAYLDGTATDFDLPLAPSGTPFQTRVWRQMCGIAYGETWSYGELARRVGSAPRPVGQACGRNPIAIVVPCHRVVGADGRLTGYSGGDGLTTKARLLDLERRHLAA